MRSSEKGEIITILALGIVSVVSLISIVGTVVINNKIKTLRTKAAEIMTRTQCEALSRWYCGYAGFEECADMKAIYAFTGVYKEDARNQWIAQKEANVRSKGGNPNNNCNDDLSSQQPVTPTPKVFSGETKEQCIAEGRWFCEYDKKCATSAVVRIFSEVYNGVTAGEQHWKSENAAALGVPPSACDSPETPGLTSSQPTQTPYPTQTVKQSLNRAECEEKNGWYCTYDKECTELGVQEIFREIFNSQAKERWIAEKESELRKKNPILVSLNITNLCNSDLTNNTPFPTQKPTATVIPESLITPATPVTPILPPTATLIPGSYNPPTQIPEPVNTSFPTLPPTITPYDPLTPTWKPTSTPVPTYTPTPFPSSYPPTATPIDIVDSPTSYPTAQPASVWLPLSIATTNPFNTTYINQCDSSWADYPNTTSRPCPKTICTMGCGPSSVTMVYNSISGKQINVKNVWDFFEGKDAIQCASKQYPGTAGIDPDSLPDFFTSNGHQSQFISFDVLTRTQAQSPEVQKAFKETMIKYMNSGWVIIANTTQWASDHFVVISEIQADGNVMVYDPYPLEGAVTGKGPMSKLGTGSGLFEIGFIAVKM